MKRLLLTALLGLGLGLLTSGCAGYRLGSMLPADIKTVYVPTFVNKTAEPQLEVETTQSLIEELQRDGSLRVVNEDQADAVLKVTLRSYKIEPVAYRSDERTSAREYRIVMHAGIVLTRRNGSVVVDAPAVRGENVFQMVGDLSSSKLTGLPAAADDLAHNIVEKVVEVW
jgi:outer membrane lipopolysaccharide assembly protein LptE/RlpB